MMFRLNVNSPPPIPSLWIHNILFALDFSSESLLALPFATSIASHYRSKLLVLHISTPDESQPHSLTSQSLLKKLEAGAEAGLLGTLGALEEIPHEFLFDHGSISSTLASVAEKYKVDLIVIGTHGRQGIRKLLNGWTAEEIALLATRPVLTVGPRVESLPDFNSILFAADVSHSETLALLYALSFAHVYGGRLVGLYVNTRDSDDSASAEAALKTFGFLQDELQGYPYAETAKSAEAVVEFGPLNESILQFAAARKADLIVIGLHNSDGIQARISAHLPGANIYDIASLALCPVLTVPLEI